jgi:S-adenosyl methyltransferase
VITSRNCDYYQGGKDHYPVDRDAGEAFLEIYPDIVEVARAVRYFLARAVSYLTLSDGANTSEARQRAHKRYAQTGAVPYRLRGPEQSRAGLAVAAGPQPVRPAQARGHLRRHGAQALMARAREQ